MVIESFMNEAELSSMGFKSLGSHVRISKKASFYGPENMTIANNVRIDDFSLLSGDIHLGNNVHIASHCAIFGRNGVTMEDYSSISSRVIVYSSTDDFSGEHMTNPTVPSAFTNDIGAPVIIKKHVVVGAGSIVHPGVTLGEGAAVGSMSLINKDLEPWTIYIGIPAKRLKDRSRRILVLEDEYRKGQEKGEYF